MQHWVEEHARDVGLDVEAAEALGLVYDAELDDFTDFIDLDPSTAAAAAAAAGPSAAAAAAYDDSDDEQPVSDLDTEDADDELVSAADEQAIKEIKRLQKSSRELLSSVAFRCIADETLQHCVKEAGYSFDPVALVALQHAAEGYLVETLELSNMCAIHAGRVKVTLADMITAQQLAKRFKPAA